MTTCGIIRILHMYGRAPVVLAGRRTYKGRNGKERRDRKQTKQNETKQNKTDQKSEQTNKQPNKQICIHTYIHTHTYTYTYTVLLYVYILILILPYLGFFQQGWVVFGWVCDYIGCTSSFHQVCCGHPWLIGVFGFWGHGSVCCATKG